MSELTPEQIAAQYRELFGNIAPAGDEDENNIPDGVDVVFEENLSAIEEAQRILDQTKPSETPPLPDFAPGSGLSIDAVRDSLLSQKKEDFKNNYPKKVAQEYSGINNTKILEPNPTYYVTEAENVIQGDHNTFIILGRDRPRGPESGAGGEVRTHTGCIDIIAGLSGPFAREVDANGEKIYTNKSPALDSARIYISQGAKNIDGEEYFHLAEGKVGYPENDSSMVVKADSLRLVGRKGIKLVTSGDNYSGGVGQLISGVIQGVDIIAGNNDADLQPMTKADNLIKVLDNLVELTSDVQNSTAFLYELLVAVLGAFIAPNYVSVMKLNNVLKRLPIEIKNLAEQDKNFVKHKFNYSKRNPIGAWRFDSKFNNVN